MPFPIARHHIVFVSEQLLPSILGIAMSGAEPSCIHAIVTTTMRQKGEVLRNVLKKRNKTCAAYDLPATDQTHVFELLDDIYAQCEGHPPAINLTGGTKLMALAAAEWAYAHDVPTFYIDTAAGQIVLPGRHWEYLSLPDMLNVEDLLAAYGYSIKNCVQEPVPPKRREILTTMLELVCDPSPAAARALQSLNACAQQARTAANRIVEDRATPSPEWEALLDLCQKAGMLHRANGYVAFPTEKSRQWCNGIWLEEFVQMTLYKLQCNKQITSWASSVQVKKNEIHNELDALFSVRNRLFVIECKTAKMNGSSHFEGRDKTSNVLYKADSLHGRLGGLFAQAILCSIEPLEPHDQSRAQSLGIRVISGKDVLKLGEMLVRQGSSAC